jgi:hypothetical protein
VANTVWADFKKDAQQRVLAEHIRELKSRADIKTAGIQ